MRYLLGCVFVLIATLPRAGAIDASVVTASFWSAETPYVEVYLHITGSTVQFEPATDSTLQARVEVLLLLRRGDTVARYDKFLLTSPLTAEPIDFIDIKRYGVPSGAYDLEVRFTDLGDTARAVDTYQRKVVIPSDKGEVMQSDVLLLSRCVKAKQEGNPFNRSGVYMEPLAYRFYHKNLSTLYFYQEIYHTDTVLSEDFLITYKIERDGAQDGTEKELIIGHKRRSPAPVVPLLISQDISELSSGNYLLTVEVRSRDNQLLARKQTNFQRSNPYLDLEENLAQEEDVNASFAAMLDSADLDYILRALTPLLPQADVDYVNTALKEHNYMAQRLYLFSFWAKESPNDPAGAYNKFLNVARAVDREFKSGFRYGFETDRGYTYLKYGPPDDLFHQEEEPSAPPYEIWTYYDFPKTGQTNVKFIFYNPSLAPGSFDLLHSTAIGERNNPQWQIMLYKNSPNEFNGTSIDANSLDDNFNRNAARIFNDN